MEPDQPEIIIG